MQLQLLKQTLDVDILCSLETVFQETTRRYNMSLECVKRGIAGEFSAVEVLAEMNREFIGWLPNGFLYPVAAAVQTSIDRRSGGFIAAANRLLELKPNFLGFGININALLELLFGKK